MEQKPTSVAPLEPRVIFKIGTSDERHSDSEPDQDNVDDEGDYVQLRNEESPRKVTPKKKNPPTLASDEQKIQIPLTSDQIRKNQGKFNCPKRKSLGVLLNRIASGSKLSETEKRSSLEPPSDFRDENQERKLSDSILETKNSVYDGPRRVSGPVIHKVNPITIESKAMQPTSSPPTRKPPPPPPPPIDYMDKSSAVTSAAAASVDFDEVEEGAIACGGSETMSHFVIRSQSYLSAQQPNVLNVTQSTENKDSVLDSFKCTICKSLFKEPRVLNCLHSFCLVCLSDIDYEMNGGNSEFWRKFSENTSEIEWIPETSFSGSLSSDQAERSLSPKPPSGLKSKRSSSKTKSRDRSTSRSNAKAPAVENKPRTIGCPICGASTEVPVGGVCRLPQNFVLMKQIEENLGKSGGQEVAKIACHLCGTIANAYCMDCGCNLCNFCKEAHRRQRTTSHHQVKSFTDKKKAKKSTPAEPQVLKCPMHPANELKLFCTICHQVICNDCIILIHRSHKCISISKASKVYIKSVKDALEKTKPLTDYALHSKLQMAELTRRITTRCAEVQREVESFLDEYFQALEVHRRTLLNQICRARESKMEVITTRQADLERRCLEARTAITFTEELLEESSSDVEKLTLVGVLIKRFEYCQRSQGALDIKISESLEFLPEVKAPSNQAQNNIPLFGIITTQTAEPRFCCLEKIEGLMNLRVHKKTELVLISKDNDDRQMCHGGLIINTELKYRDSSARRLPTQVSDKRDGTYIISFVPDSAGLMILTITINGKSIKDSPFTLRSRTLKPHTGLFHCCAFCSSGGSKSATCACKATMPGGYSGCGHGHPGHPGRRHWSCCGNILENSECSVANDVINQSTETITN